MREGDSTDSDQVQTGDSSALRPLVKRISNVAGARLVAAVMQAGIIVVLARVLQPSGFGAFAALTAIGAVVGVALGFGTTTAALRVQAVREPATRASNLLLIRVLSGAVAVGAIWVVGVLAFGEHTALLWFVAVYLVAELLTDLLQALLLGMVEVGRASVVIIVRRFLPLLGALAAPVIGVPILVAITAGLGVSVALAFALTVPHLALPARIADTVRGSLHYWSSTTVIAFQRLDIFLVSTLGTAASGGAYAAAQRLASPAHTITSSILGILTPQLSSVPSRSQRLELFRRSRKLVAGFALVLTLAAPVAGYLAPYLLGAAYAGIGVLVTCAVVAAALDGIAQVYASHYYAEGRARRLFHLRLISVPTSLAVVAAVAASGNVGLLPVAILVAPTLAVILLHLGSTRSRQP